MEQINQPAPEKAGSRDRLSACVFLSLIAVLFILNLVVKPPDILMSERRARAPLPAITGHSLLSGNFMSGFEDYAADAFIFRDDFRRLKAETVFHVFMQTDKSGLYFGAAGAGEFKALDPVAARQSAEKIKKVMDTIKGCFIYYSIVPDKSIYAGKYLPGFELEPAERILAEVLDGAVYIPLADCLTAGSFYRTDLHWDQPSIGGVVNRLFAGMDARRIDPEYPAISFTQIPARYAGEFKGVYAGQLALPMAADQMYYMDLTGLKAQKLNDRTLQFEECPVYDLERFKGADPYDIFLQGPQAVVLLENPDAPGGDLYLFRDSYGSSLAPLLTSAYRRIALIDLRYIDVRALDQFVEFEAGADVLFLYSSQILNNPSVLRV